MSFQSIKQQLPPNVTLVAVTKHRSVEAVQTLIDDGVTDIGENRLQEAQEKLPQLKGEVTKHFIGRLQTNKVREVVQLFDVIQTVDRLKLAKKIDEECEKIGKVMPVLIQVNTSNESQKGGVAVGEAEGLILEAVKLKHIKIIGLMTMAMRSENRNEITQCFRLLKQFFDEFKNTPSVEMNVLSMGMSEDYELAIAEGATMVRIGRKLFR